MSVYTNRMAISSWLMYPGDSDGRMADDKPWSEEDIYNKLLEHRSVVVMRALNERGEVSDAMRQIIPCIKMERIDRIECPMAPPSGCYWARSVEPIPTPILLDNVSNVMGTDNFIHTAWNKVARIKHSRIKSKRKSVHYFLRENGESQTHIYILLEEVDGVDITDVPAITASGIFHTPLDVGLYCGCGKPNNDAKCHPLDEPFYTDLNLRPMVFRLTWDTLLQLRANAPTDNLNNDVVDRKEQRKAGQ